MPPEFTISSVIDGENEVVVTQFQVAQYFIVHARDEAGQPVTLKFASPAAQNLRSFLSALPKATP